MSAIRDFASQFGVAFAGAGRATAGGTGDNTAVVSPTIDLDGFYSGALVIVGSATLAEDDTLSIGVTLEESADGSTWDDPETIYASDVVATGDTGGSTENIALKIADAFVGRKRYVRFSITPDLSAAATDTATWAAGLVKGGALEKPVS